MTYKPTSTHTTRHTNIQTYKHTNIHLIYIIHNTYTYTHIPLHPHIHTGQRGAFHYSSRSRTEGGAHPKRRAIHDPQGGPPEAGITIIDTMYHNNRHNYTQYTH
jgi:hypothetical protein